MKHLWAIFLFIYILTFSSISAQQFTFETSNKNSRVRCVKKFKKYDDNELNSFLQNSYDICNQISTLARELDNINNFVEDPVAWMIVELKKSASPYTKTLKRSIDRVNDSIGRVNYANYIMNNPEVAAQIMVDELERRINDYIFDMLFRALNDGKDRVADSKMMANIAASQRNIQQKLSGAKDVANAVENYRRALSYLGEFEKQLRRSLNNLEDLSSGKISIKYSDNNKDSESRVGARAYSDSKYSGSSSDIEFNDYPTMHNSVNDKISSIEVFPGYQVVIFSDGNFNGRSKVLTESQSDLNQFDFNDKISSLKVQELDSKNEPIVYVFYDNNFKGRYNFFGLGEFGSIWPNDRISSVKIRNGYELTIYEHGDFKGKSHTLRSDMSSLKKIRFDDKTSSLKVKSLQ